MTLPWTRVGNDLPCCGHERLDRDHRYFLDGIKRLRLMITTSPDTRMATPLLIEIAGHIEHHVEMEEQLMMDSGYHSAAAHKKDHVFICDELFEIMYRFKGMCRSTKLLSVRYIGDLIANHISSQDMAFAHYLMEHSTLPAPAVMFSTSLTAQLNTGAQISVT